VTKPSDNRSALAIAYQWASRIMVVSLVMVLPGVAGYWVDTKLGTVCLFLVIGLIVGSFTGVWQLLQMTRQKSDSGNNEQ
jgi:F0F1-type ATP synthase assembly protein I